MATRNARELIVSVINKGKKSKHVKWAIILDIQLCFVQKRASIILANDGNPYSTSMPYALVVSTFVDYPSNMAPGKGDGSSQTGVSFTDPSLKFIKTL